MVLLWLLLPVVSWCATSDVVTITGLDATAEKWSGGVAAGTKFYGIPHNSESVLIVDTLTNTANTTAISGLSGSTKWRGGVLVGTKIYAMPFTDTNVLIVDTTTDTADTSTITGLSGASKWWGGVEVGNKVYGIPFVSEEVLIIDTTTDTADTSTITGLTGPAKWAGGVVVGTKIYGIPYFSTSVLIIDTSTDTADTSTITGLTGNSKWLGGVVMGTKIYGIPFEASSVLIIDTTSDTADTTTITGYSDADKWYFGVAMGTKIYGIPSDASSALVIDTETDTANATTISGLTNFSQKWAGAVTIDARVYGIPYDSTSVLIIADPTAAFKLIKYTPTNGATNRFSFTNITLKFEVPVMRGSGSIVLTPTALSHTTVPAGSPLTIPVSDANQVKFFNPPNNANMTIVPGGWWSDPLEKLGAKYTVTMSSGAVENTLGVPYPAIGAVASNNQDNKVYEFTIEDTVPPVIGSSYPVDEAVAVSKAVEIVLTFTELVQVGDSPGFGINITLVPSGGNQPNEPVIINAADSTQFNVSGYTATISPSTPLDDRGNKTWSLLMDVGAVKDTSDVLHLGLDGTEYNFTVLDSTVPTITTYSPAINETDAVTNQSIILTFSEDILIGSGTVVLSPSGGNLLNTPVSINIADSTQVSVSGNVLTISPTGGLDDIHGKRYSVEMPSGCLTDVVGNIFGGIPLGEYNFDVIDTTTPRIIDYMPARGQTNVDENTQLVWVLAERVRKGAGNITLTPNGGTGAAAVVIDIQSSDVVISNSSSFPNRTVTVTLPTGSLVPGNEYIVEWPEGVLLDDARPINGIPAMPDGKHTPQSTKAPHSNYTFMVKAKIVLAFSSVIDLALATSGNVYLGAADNRNVKSAVSIDDAAQVTLTKNEILLRPVLEDQLYGREYTLVLSEGIVEHSTTSTKCAGAILNVNQNGGCFYEECVWGKYKTSFRPMV